MYEISQDLYSDMEKINDEEIIAVGGGGVYKPYEGSLIIINYKTGIVIKNFYNEFEGHVASIAAINPFEFATINRCPSNSSYIIKLFSPYI